MNLLKRCLQRKLFSLILISLIIAGFVGFVNIIHVFGQPSITLKWRSQAAFTGNTWLGPLVADVNNDGSMEIVTMGVNGVAALDRDGNRLWISPYGGDHACFEIIDLNKDGIPEILVSIQYIGGSPSQGVVALHGNDGSVYWYNPNAAGSGTWIAVADINGDEYPEIYCARGGLITALTHDGNIFASTWTYYPCWGGMSIGDTDFDGVFEVYLGERSESYPEYPSGGRGLRAFWADNLTEIWAHPDILCSSQAPALVDVDKDGDLEIIVHQQGSGGGIAVINTDGSVNTYNGIYRKEWGIPDLGRGHTNPTIADVDDDGNLEFMYCGNADPAPSRPTIFDLVDWKVEARLPFDSYDPPTVADIDGDGKLEIINCNMENVTIFKYNPATENYDVIDTIFLETGHVAHAFSIVQDIDGDNKLELVFGVVNTSWIYVYDVEAPALTPKPRSGLYFYSQYRTREAVYVPPPEQPPRISEVSPNDGATNVPVSLSELSFKLTDFQSDPMDYTVTTNPDIIGGSCSDTNVPAGTKITIPISGLDESTTYTWTVTVTDGTHTTTRTFAFYTEGNVTLNISTVGDGSVIKNPDSVDNVYAYGTPVQLTAVADNVVYEFSHWDGDLAWMGNNNPATILVDGNKTVIANFTQIEYRLRTYISPTGSGTITLNNTGLWDPPTRYYYYYGEAVELTAVPNPSCSFSHWERDLNGSQNPTTIIMTEYTRVEAVFTLGQCNLTITVIGNGNVTKEPENTTYTYGESVTLTAVPDVGWKFVEWGGNISGSENPITIVMDGNKSVTVTFTQKQNYTLNIDTIGNGTVNKNPDYAVYTEGENVTLTATADPDWTFAGWIGDVSSSENPITIMMDGNKSVTVIFTEEQYYTLNITIIGNGTVNKNPDYAVYTEGENVTLTAIPDVGWKFVEWSGNITSSDNPITFIIAGNMSITAHFTLKQYVINASVSGTGGTIEPSGIVNIDHGEDITFNIAPYAGYDISDVLVDGESEGPITTYTFYAVDMNHTITAFFAPRATTGWQYRRTVTIDRTRVSGTLTDFSILIEILDSSLIGKTQPNGYDFVFTDANNVKLSHQIEFYDSTIGQLTVWVNVPYLSSTTDTILYMYYGNPTCEDQQDSTAVWDTNYKLVLHLNENTGIHYDSTINDNDGTAYNGVLQDVTGKIDGADAFDGVDDYVEIPHSSTLAGYTEALTVSFWIRIEDTSRRQTILCKYNTQYHMRGWQIEYDPVWQRRQFWFMASQDGITYSEWWAPSFVPQADTWYYVTVVWEANAIPKFYINGVQIATTGTSTISSIYNNAGVPLRIARSNYATNRYFKGSLDEITISSQARSADWILTAYNNQLNPTTFYSVGAEETFQEAYVLTVYVDGNGSVIITPEKEAYTQGDIVILTATPEEGYEFQGWSGDLTGTDNPTNITITKNMTITAHFTLK